jgi:NitT/TauT family transport system substrate-binding protein
MRFSALARSAAWLAAATLLLGLGSYAVPPPAPALAAQGATRVQLGLVVSTSDAGFYVGIDQGYYLEQGLELETIPFDSAARMVVPLGAGQLDVGGGSHSAGLFNAIARGISIKLVGDKGSLLPGHGFVALLLQRELAASGRLRTPDDLRGRRVATTAMGNIGDIVLAGWLRQAGLTLDDVELVELGFPDHASALASGAVDASSTIEPFVTRILDQGVGRLYGRADTLLPGHQIAEVFYSAQFARERPELGRRFMVAYLRAVRYYNDAFSRGDVARRQEVITTLARHTPVRDVALYDRMVMPGLNPDGRVNVASLAADQEFWLARGVQQARVDLSEVVDYSFVDAALQALGPYR